MDIFLGILMPLVGTVLGAMAALFIKNASKKGVIRALSGFAAGVMTAASVWSLLIPAIEQVTSAGGIGWIPAAAGFFLGTGFLIILDILVTRLCSRAKKLPTLGNKRNTMLFLAVTLHNIPEGMAVGVALAGLMAHTEGITAASALALSAGIAIQNIPEGAIVAVPQERGRKGRIKAFFTGALSGIVEPVFSVLTILLTAITVPILPYMLSFAAGAMMYVVIKELIPESQSDTKSYIGVIGAAIGFVLMMTLDVAVG